MCGIFALLSRSYASKYNSRRLMRSFQQIQPRGPDNTHKLVINPNVFFGFHRLAINDLSELGNQPFCFENDGLYLICNGEIYNHELLEKEYSIKTNSHSDCEVILHMYKQFGIEKTIKSLDGVFAFVIYDSNKDCIYAGRDPIGVRPMFIGYDNENEGIFLASEAKAFIDFTKNVKQFEPGSYWCSDKPDEFIKYWELNNDNILITNESDALKMINEDLSLATRKRLMSDRPIGTFLSGGLDSSLITALVNKYIKEEDNTKTLNTYAIGMEGATDLDNAMIAAEHMKTNHENVVFTIDEGIDAIEDVIRSLESFDITTVRASVGMYLLSEHISQKTNDIVIYSGEGSDEVTQGYLYFHNQPDSFSGANDSLRLVNQLNYFDVCRVDRTVSNHGLEVRVPFLDKQFIKNYFSISPELRTPKYKGIEKYLVRQAFEDKGQLLPREILWRTKEAFSDGVSGLKKGKGWHQILTNYVDSIITDKEYEDAKEFYKSNNNIIPVSKEAYWYRKIYDKYYGGTQLIPFYWLPRWSGNTNDPSARTINTYSKLIPNTD